MTSSMPSPARSTAGRRRGRLAIAITAIVIAVLVIGFFALSGLYADVLWYRQIGYLEVLTTRWAAVGSLFAIGFVGMAVPVWLCMYFAYRQRPVYAQLGGPLDRYQEVVEPLRRLAGLGVPILLGFFGGVAAATRWSTVLMWLNRTPSGTTDPQFHFDISFYTMTLPFYRGTVAFSSAVVLLALIAGVAVLYLYGAISIVGRELRISRAARIQISITAGVYLLLQAVSLWLDQYATVTDTSGTVDGALYTDVHATIPGRTIMAGIAVVVAILFFITAVIGRWRLPIVGTALLIVASLLVGSLYPWAVQRFHVEPSEKSVEQEYIQRNIDATRKAYGVSNVKETQYSAKTKAEPGALRDDATTTANIRILDPSIVSATFSQLQQIKQYYTFPSDLSVDRYTIDGKVQDAVVAARELDLTGLSGTTSWVNSHLVYTHGYGLVAAYGTKRTADGLPVFLEKGIPTTGSLGSYQPRIYFGQSEPDYSIVGGDTKNVELDYPSSSSGSTTAAAAKTTYAAQGGPTLSNALTRLVYAVKFQSEQILLSNSVSSSSQILYDRDPLTRVQKIAPYLTLDKSTYPSVVNGRVVWIVDGYTTSNAYPYSQSSPLGDNTAGTTATTAAATATGTDNVNYVRNSVKATVDAYTGKVTLYAWDTTDPILKTWQKIFPSTLKPVSAMSAQLLSHVRYPTDLFATQRSVLGSYHVTKAGAFYSKEDSWITPEDPVKSTDTSSTVAQAQSGLAGSNVSTVASAASTLQPPYYLTLSAAEGLPPEYSQYSTYIPNASASSTRSVLSGYLSVDSNAGGTAGKKGAGYGTLRLLVLKGVSVSAPGQVQNSFDTDPDVSKVLNILRQGGQTTVKSGNLLTLPVGGGLLYVQPVYVQSTSGTSYPTLQKVLVSFGGDIAFEDTLDEALDKLFGGDSGAQAGDESASGGSGSDTSGDTSTDTGTDTGGSGTSSGDSTKLQKALSDVQDALAARDKALSDGNWTEYGKQDAKLKAAIARAIAAE